MPGVDLEVSVHRFPTLIGWLIPAPGTRWSTSWTPFERYYLIFMIEEDVDKTAFVTEYGIYCSKIIAFGLKNVGATYQSMVNKETMRPTSARALTTYEENAYLVLDKQLEKLFKGPRHMWGLIFKGDFIVFRCYVKPNPDKIATMQAMRPRTQKEAQRLTGRIIALTRFISNAGDRSLPFFKDIKKGKKFEWTPECEKSFQEL
ncbi:hypothetical protein LIER_35950 [Lithospermum erythrorhizon]|uniref:Uncharacterized protein n=1 Tax=Lithospermum erythrorhizon TaxID=34254 RepID=A0AAV3NYV8_LITER